MDVTVPDIPELLPYVKHADAFVLTCVPCVIVAGAEGVIQKNVVAVAGRGCPVRRAPCAYRWRPVLRDEGTSLFTERSLPGRCHRERCVSIRTRLLGQTP
jgi:hypothetical protein